MFRSIKRILVAFAVSCTLSHCLVYADGGKPAECDGIDPFGERDPVFDERKAAKIRRSFQNTTAIGISWSLDEVEDTSDLCGFTVHWTENGSQTGEKHYAVRQPNVTEHIVSGLKPGTAYIFYVLTYYATRHVPRSWFLRTTTYGCGKDYPDFCDVKNSDGCVSETGQCICKPPSSGDKCETCPHGFYMHSSHGCTGCDHCPRDNITSTGSCTPAKDPEDTMFCDCIFPYTGKHCSECADKYYLKDGVCSPCVCHHNTHTELLSEICEKLTGKCICSEDRRGDFCELCAFGFQGDPLGEGCYFAQRTTGGIKALIVLVVMILVLGLIVALVVFCRRMQRRRQGKAFWIIQDHDKVNFSTLEEEPETDAHHKQNRRA